MKKMISIALLLTTIIVSTVLVGGLLVKSDRDKGANTSQQMTIQPTTNPPTQSSLQTITANEVATHNKSDDCWVIIKNDVYNLTGFIPQHPGGAEKIIKNCGKDATKQFNTQDGEGGHSSTARNLKQTYLYRIITIKLKACQ